MTGAGKRLTVLLERASGEGSMLINAYGLFWRADEVDWSPGSGNHGQFRLLGRSGVNRPGLRVADFRFHFCKCG